MTEEYYILESGQKMGPFTADELLDRPLEPDDMVLLPGLTDYKPAHSLREFDEYFKDEGIFYPSAENTTSYLLRLPAFIIDYFLIVIIIMILGVVLFPAYMVQLQQMYTPQPFTYQKYLDNAIKYQTQTLILQTVLFAILVVYNAVCEASGLRGSIGKYACGLAVVDGSGYSLSFKQALLRNLGKIVYELMSFVIGPLSYLFYLRMIWSERHQAIHDRFAGCYIVKKNA